jgi:ribonuclease E
MVCLSLLRRIEARAATGSIQGVRIGLHPELADALQNHYRRELADIESEFQIEVEIAATAGLHRPDEKIEWRRREKPLPPPKPKQAAITFQPWDLASMEDEDEEEDFEDGEEPGGRSPEAAGEAGEAGEAGAGKRRRRRRGGRKRKKKGVPGENGGNTSQEAAPEPASEGERPRSEPDLAPVLEGPEFMETPADSFDDEGDEEGEEDFEEGAEAAGADGETDKPGGGAKRRRRRRRRRK